MFKIIGKIIAIMCYYTKDDLLGFIDVWGVDWLGGIGWDCGGFRVDENRC